MRHTCFEGSAREETWLDKQGVKCNMYQGVTSLARMHAQVHSTMAIGAAIMHWYCTTGLFGVRCTMSWLEHSYM